MTALEYLQAAEGAYRRAAMSLDNGNYAAAQAEAAFAQATATIALAMFVYEKAGT